MKEKGDSPPTILLSLARAYPHLRGQLVHAGHVTPLKEHDVNSLVTNTSDLISALFPPEASEDLRGMATMILSKGTDSEIVREIRGLDAGQKEKVVIALIEMRNEYRANSRSMSDWYEKSGKCEEIVIMICKSLANPQLTELLGKVAERFTLTNAQYVMELLSNWASLNSVAEMLKEKGLLDWAVSSFAQSGSYDGAGTNSLLINRIAPLLSKPQLEDVLSAIVDNDQIMYSESARGTLTMFLSWVNGKVDPELYKRVRDGYLRN